MAERPVPVWRIRKSFKIRSIVVEEIALRQSNVLSEKNPNSDR